MNEIKKIATGKNVYLREYQASDTNLVKQWFQNLELASYSFGITTTDENLQKIVDAFVAEVSQTPQITITIVDNESDEPVGFIRTTYIFFPAPHITLGMSLGNLNSCGKSFGYEAMMLVINYLFNTKKILYIEVDTAVFNERAMRCFYKCGFRTVKNFTETEYVTKVKTHKTLFRITRKDFMPKYEEYIKKLQEKV